jgi:hypothetical protein
MQQKNKSILIGYYGSDEHHALAAWTSTYLELGIEMPQDMDMRVPALVEHILSKSKKMRSVRNLLHFLGEHKHISPFRFSFFHFATTIDIATHIHFLKHSVALRADNGESARYKELKEDKYYIPKDWLKHESRIVQKWAQKLKDHSDTGNDLYHNCLQELTPIIGRTRAKETARYFKGYNAQINTQKAFSFGSFAEVYHKRNSITPSQKEIAWEIECMRDQIQETGKFNESLKALGIWKQ